MPVKQKTCKMCKAKFTPLQPLQMVCGHRCALDYSRGKMKATKKKETRELKEQLKTKSEYLKDLQIVVNEIVKYIDWLVPCISSGRPTHDSRNSGHMFGVQAYPALRFNLFNIHNQSIVDNQHKGGRPIEYMDGLRAMYGKDYLDYVMSLREQYKRLSLSIPEIKEKIKIAKEIVKELKKDVRQYDEYQRFWMRKNFNKRLGIYE